MVKVVQKRLETRGLTLEQVINPDAFRLLAMTSGGVMRELMRYMQEAATSNSAKVTLSNFLGSPATAEAGDPIEHRHF